jgi:hypothetical protein
MKKFTTLLIVFSLVVLSSNLFAKEKQGTNLIIQKSNAQQVRGELIAVKQNSLLLLERESGADVSVDLREIKFIKIKKKLGVLPGAGLGLIIGLGVGHVVGSSMEPKRSIINYAAYGRLIGASIGFISGLLIGGLVFPGGSETIRIGGKSETEIQETLEKLRSKARVKNFQ